MSNIRSYKNQILYAVLPAMLFCMACQKSLHFDNGPAADHLLTIIFKPVVDADSLQFGKLYRNAFNESYSVRNFKFYLEQVDLINSDSGITYYVNKTDNFLIDFGDPQSINIQFKAVAATYNQVAFLLGVDSIHNVSGAQTGALDPTRGMFWTWNSGYIMAKLEGNSTVSSQPNQVFEYHIGGFEGPDKVVQRVGVPFPSNTGVMFVSGKSSVMTISANVNAWFSGQNPITIASTPVCTTPGSLAKTISENYATMFTVISIVSE